MIDDRGDLWGGSAEGKEAAQSPIDHRPSIIDHRY
jgi:hypothetical protein